MVRHQCCLWRRPLIDCVCRAGDWWVSLSSVIVTYLSSLSSTALSTSSLPAGRNALSTQHSGVLCSWTNHRELASRRAQRWNWGQFSGSYRRHYFCTVSVCSVLYKSTFYLLTYLLLTGPIDCVCHNGTLTLPRVVLL